jgi:hypothetical protein
MWWWASRKLRLATRKLDELPGGWGYIEKEIYIYIPLAVLKRL